MKELEATEKRLRETLQGRMKEANISSIKVGKVELEYNPEATKKILDRNKLSESGTRNVEKCKFYSSRLFFVRGHNDDLIFNQMNIIISFSSPFHH